MTDQREREPRHHHNFDRWGYCGGCRKTRQMMRAERMKQIRDEYARCPVCGRTYVNPADSYCWADVHVRPPALLFAKEVA
jgi:hypothetical protein